LPAACSSIVDWLRHYKSCKKCLRILNLPLQEEVPFTQSFIREKVNFQGFFAPLFDSKT
jgi:hypothetical protein